MNGFANRIRSATQDFTARSSSEASALEGAPGVLWSAKGQPLTGIGGGRYRLTATTLFFERGTLTTNAQQVPTNQLFDIDLRQSLTQKTRGVGDVVVHVQRASRVEQVILNDVPNPREAVNIINEVANQARINAHTMANTRHFTSNPAPAVPASPPEAAPPMTTAPDAIEQLTKLGQLRDAGILTEDEFAQKKADILARM
ncbi:SHOCT domain-containing protein [Rhodococcus sp. IEGM 1318]|uniref:SHOCT domain-containing protein n=1 Tax=Rhodococcus sp. IEGM 1318 TaxID=3082226 RepID=UPI0029530B1B|nr:SHOCT domain-containing protein [Rhodococcus sp. IEGM 1318]MDV8004316.1 SHOCT domain-containing protein [Rhodococcus sp. IEGM 1318]